MPYVLERACLYLAETVEVAERVRAEQDRDPAGSSRMVEEQDQLAGRAYQHHLDATSLATIQLAAAEDQLAAMAKLVSAANTIFAVYTLARTVAELCARAAWLLDPSISARSRAERGLHDRLASLKEQENLPLEGAKEHARSRRRDVSRQAQAEGVSVSDDNRRPSATQLVRWCMADAQDNVLGEMTYKLLSAYSHGTSYALHLLLDPATAEGTVTEGLARARLTTHAATEATVVAMAFLPYMAAVRSQFALAGWPTNQLEGSLAYTGSEVSRILRIYGRRHEQPDPPADDQSSGDPQRG